MPAELDGPLVEPRCVNAQRACPPSFLCMRQIFRPIRCLLPHGGCTQAGSRQHEPERGLANTNTDLLSGQPHRNPKSRTQRIDHAVPHQELLITSRTTAHRDQPSPAPKGQDLIQDTSCRLQPHRRLPEADHGRCPVHDQDRNPRPAQVRAAATPPACLLPDQTRPCVRYIPRARPARLVRKPRL